MLPLLLCCASLLPPALQDRVDRKPPDPALVERTLEDLKRAFAKGSVEDEKRAIAASREVADAAVIEWVRKGLRSKEREVQMAAIEALRWTDHPDALEALHRTLEKDKKLRKDEELVTALLKAIGQHASASSIRILSDDPFAVAGKKAAQARILALARIRDSRSLEALIAMMRKSGPRGIRGGQGPYMESFRLALMELSGTDQGASRDRWVRWWNDHKKSLTVDPRRSELPSALERRWRAYWGIRGEAKRRERREDRGGDPERRGGRRADGG